MNLSIKIIKKSSCRVFLAGVIVFTSSFFSNHAFAVFSTPVIGNWAVDGDVYEVLALSDRVVIGGRFDEVGAISGSATPISLYTADSAGFTFPQFGASVYAIIKDGSGGYYVGGSFTEAGSTTRNRIAHILSDGTIDASWDPSADGAVRALVLSPDGATVYVGGDFTTIGGQTRNRIAALNVSDGQAATWNPNMNDVVRVLQITSDGSAVYAGGDFITVGIKTRNRIVSIKTSDGTLNTWNPNSDGVVRALIWDETNSIVYAGGNFATIGGQTRNRIAALNTSGTATIWNPNSNGVVRALALSSDTSTVYTGGEFGTIGGSIRRYAAALNASDGTATSWDPDADAAVHSVALDTLTNSSVFIGGNFKHVNSNQSRRRIAQFNISDGTLADWNPGANAIVNSILFVDSASIYLGGDFTSAGNGLSASNLVVFRLDGSAVAWDIQITKTGGLDGTVSGLAASPDGSTIYVGGDFNIVANGADQVTRNNIMAINSNSGAYTSWDPNINGIVRALQISSDGSTIYAGGSFTTVGGTARNYIASIKTSDGTLNTWNPNGGDIVRALALTSDEATVYAGGDFTTIGGQTRNRIAALNTSGTATTWNPNSDGVVRAIALTSDEATIYAGGDFTTIGGQTRNGIAALNTSGTATTWNPNSNGVVYGIAITPDDGTIYVGGQFSTIGGGSRNRLATIKASDGLTTTWNPNMDNVVRAIFLNATGSILYVGGDFRKVGTNITDHFTTFDSPDIRLVSYYSETYGLGKQVSENVVTATMQVELSEANTVDTIVSFSNVAPTIHSLPATGGGVDFTLVTSSPITIPAGQTTADISITIVDDSLYEQDEAIILTLSSPKNGEITSPAGMLSDVLNMPLYIVDNDAPPQIDFTSTSGSGSENVSPAAVPIRLSVASAKAAQAKVRVTGGTAVEGVDYLFPQSLTEPLIEAGATTLNIDFTIINDADVESNETIVFTMTDPDSATLGTNTTFTYTIVNDD